MCWGCVMPCSMLPHSTVCVYVCRTNGSIPLVTDVEMVTADLCLLAECWIITNTVT